MHAIKLCQFNLQRLPVCVCTRGVLQIVKTVTEKDRMESHRTDKPVRVVTSTV